MHSAVRERLTVGSPATPASRRRAGGSAGLRTAAGFALLASFAGTDRAPAQDGEVHELRLVTIADRRATTEDAETPLHTLGLTGESVAQFAPTTLARQLAGLPGVVMQESFGGFDPPRLSIRGSGVQSAPVNRGVLWTVDGLPINAADGSFMSALIDPALFESASVQAGAGDAIAATQALGGELRLESPCERAPASTWLSFGDHRGIRAGGRVGTARVASTRWDAGATWCSWDGWRPQSAQSRQATHVRYRHEFGTDGPGWAVTIYAADAVFDIPGPLTLQAAHEAPGTVSAAVALDRPRRESTLARIASELRWSGSDAGATRLAISYQYCDDGFRQLRATGTSETTGVDLSGLCETTRPIGQHLLRAGVLVRSGSRSQDRWLTGSAAGRAPFAELTVDSGHVAAWLEDVWTLDPRVEVETGLSMMHASRDSRGSPVTACGSFSDTEPVPRLTLRWRAHPHLTVTARATRGVEPPTSDDLIATRGPPAALTAAWVPLRTQAADTLELSASGQAGALLWTCTGYEARWHRELLRLADSGGSSIGTVNAGRTRHRGVESAVRWRCLDGRSGALDLAITHTWSTATFLDGGAYQGRELAGLPHHAGSASLAWTTTNGPFLVVGATWIGGRTWADHANRLGYPGYVVASLGAGWRFSPAWSVRVDVDNILDRGYIASTAGVVDLARDPGAAALFLPGAPRQLRFGLSWHR